MNILYGLKHLKDNKILHRDLKPENILFRFNGSNSPADVVITDFGLADYHHDKGTYLF